MTGPGAEGDGGEGSVTERIVGGYPVRGVAVDPEIPCARLDSDRDVIAIRAPYCDAYYPCLACHEAVADHRLNPIPAAEFDDPGVLCGAEVYKTPSRLPGWQVRFEGLSREQNRSVLRGDRGRTVNYPTLLAHR
jgi:hypothetical protein